MIDTDFYTALNSLTGSVPVYPVIADESATPPFVIYTRTGTFRERDLNGEIGRIEASYRLDIYDEDLLAAENLADTLATGLLTYKVGKIKDIVIDEEENASDLSGEPGLYRWMMLVTVVWH